MANNLNYDFLEPARSMPPMIHKIKGDEFDVMKSKVCDYLCSLPSVRQKIFEMAKDHKFITYDSASGTWKGDNSK